MNLLLERMEVRIFRRQNHRLDTEVLPLVFHYRVRLAFALHP